MSTRIAVRTHARRLRSGATTVSAHTRNRAGKGDAWGAEAARKAMGNAAKAAKAKDAATRKKFLKRTQEDVDAGIEAIDTRPDIARTDMS